MKAIRRGLKVASALTTVLLFAVVVLLFLMNFTNISIPLSLQQVLTGSMNPKITVNSLVVNITNSSEDYEVGDVITYHAQSDKLTHRIVSKQADEDGIYYITKGDANQQQDQGVVRPTQVIGRVVLSVPFLGRFGEILQTPQGTIAVVLTIIQLWLLYDFVVLLKAYAQEEKEEQLGIIREEGNYENE